MEAYRRYGPALVRKAARMLQDEEEAMDVVHELFVDMLERGDSTFELPYLYRALTRRCLNLLRSRSTRKRLLGEHELALPRPAPAASDEQTLGLDVLHKLAGELDGQTWELMVYRFVDDMSLDEISALTRISRKTVSKRLAGAQAAVDRLSGTGGGEA